MKTFLGSQELAQHRAMVAVELEVLAKKFDRFGWDRDRGTMAQDRILTDWMDALQNYPLPEVMAACRAAVIDDPKNMPNEGHILRHILEARREVTQAHKRALPPPPEPERKPMTAEQAAAIMAEVGFKPKPFGYTEYD